MYLYMMGVQVLASKCTTALGCICDHVHAGTQGWSGSLDHSQCGGWLPTIRGVVGGVGVGLVLQLELSGCVSG